MLDLDEELPEAIVELIGRVGGDPGAAEELYYQSRRHLTKRDAYRVIAEHALPWCPLDVCHDWFYEHHPSDNVPLWKLLEAAVRQQDTVRGVDYMRKVLPIWGVVPILRTFWEKDHGKALATAAIAALLRSPKGRTELIDMALEVQVGDFPGPRRGPRRGWKVAPHPPWIRQKSEEPSKAQLRPQWIGRITRDMDYDHTVFVGDELQPEKLYMPWPERDMDTGGFAGVRWPTSGKFESRRT